MKSNEMKRRYIEVAFDIIQREGRDGVTIRRLGRILDCNMASLYRCFHDLDELFLYTGIKYVKGYLQDVSRLMDEPHDALELYLKLWECFSRHSFENPNMYNALLFGKYSSKFAYATEEYYSTLFPEEMVEVDDETKETLMKGSFHTGDTLLTKTLIRCVEEDLIREADRKFIDTLHLQIFKGYLKDFIDNRRNAEMIEQSQAELMNCYRMITSKYRVPELI